MDFTRQPIIETVITAKEGCKLVIRSSKGAGSEEYFVDAIEVVSFGNTFFFRSQEKPKSFLVPATDYEVLEVREARMVLKNVGMNRSIKIGGGKEKAQKESDKSTDKQQKDEEQESQSPSRQTERKRDRRRSFRRRKRGDDQQEQQSDEQAASDASLIPPPPMANKPIKLPEPKGESVPKSAEDLELSNAVLNSLLPPPPNLISDTIEKYKDNKLFEGVFLGSEKKKVDEPESADEEFDAPDDNETVEDENPFDATDDTIPDEELQGDLDQPEEQSIESIEASIVEQVSVQGEEEDTFEFTEEREQQIVEQRQKFEQQEDPLIADNLSEVEFPSDPFIMTDEEEESSVADEEESTSKTTES